MSVAESLEELKTALLNTPVPVLRESRAEDPKYAQQFKAFRKLTDQADIQSNVVSSHLLNVLEGHSPYRELKVLSVGCGDGIQDNMILTKVLASCPTARINYTGIDINPQFCTETEERLKHLPIDKNFICESFETMDVSNLGTFDFVYLVHVHYYFQQQQSAVFCKVRELLTSKGKCVVVASPPNLHNNLITQFWSHEGKRNFQTMDAAVKALEEIGITYQLEGLCAKLYLSGCFEDEWSSNFSRFVLDFLCGTALNRYPDNISELCKSYLTAATSDGPEEFVLPLKLQVVCFKAQ